MRIFVAITAIVAAFSLAGPAAAQDDPNWERITVPSGTASYSVPCAKQDIQTGQMNGVDAAGCKWQGFQIMLLVMPEQMWDIEGVTDQPYDQTREQLLADPGTAYLNDIEIANTRGFYAEGMSSSGKVATVMIDLNQDRLLIMLVESDNSPAAEAGISDLFAKVWGSLEVAPQ